ncbi:Rid family detoxifying hydrolase [Escherichia coli]|uniref:Rid family detoxifying hydrolase n=1 Tax=Escherichia coli TaxID=562 RepID=UPI001495F668|nr:Rid family detoxifying hydrolase [Escherichia coli]MBA1749292.1 RidA family protein [Escherichia coli]NPJ84286.1 RidA family protein [Escherichia coli]HAI2487220.1 RidA family protein [Escherichia coli]HBC0797525.1 RidA family protein [Escherichia coli]
MKKDIIYTTGAPVPGGALSQAVKAGETIYLAGQVGFDPHTMQVVSTDFDEQARQAFKNLLSVAEAAGGSDKDIVKLNAYLTDVNMFPRFNAIMSEYFSPPYPARATLGIAALPQGAVIEIEAIMVL